MPEVRLIDANVLIKNIAESIRLADEWEKESHEKKDKHGIKCAIDTRRALMAMISMVKEAPTSEPEVRHGRWILCKDQYNVDNDNGNYAYYCSCCKHQDVHAESAKVSFCWNCGAKMGEGE